MCVAPELPGPVFLGRRMRKGTCWAMGVFAMGVFADSVAYLKNFYLIRTNKLLIFVSNATIWAKRSKLLL